MILADKIASLRKQAGMTQEAFAERLGVTRQSVSKWESALSVPDMDKVLQMSRLFGVSTDYLLKDEIEEPLPEHPAASAGEDGSLDPASGEPLRQVSLEEASEFLRLNRAAAPRTATAVALCILSPVCLLLLGALGEDPSFPLSQEAGLGIGLTVLLTLVAAAVALFLVTGAGLRRYEFLDTDPFETQYGVTGMARERLRDYEPVYTRGVVVGTVLCVLCAVPLFMCMVLGGSDDGVLYAGALCLLLALVAAGVFALVLVGTRRSGMLKLLQEGDYTRSRKATVRVARVVSLVYWMMAVAIYLWLSFGPSSAPDATERTWAVWPVAGVLFAAVLAVVKLVMMRRRGVR